MKQVTSTNRLDNLISEELKRTNGNISKVARSLGIDYFAMKGRLNGQSLIDNNFRPATGSEPVDIRVLGRPGFEQYVIAIKRQGGFWGTKHHEALRAARRAFDAGTHEMFQAPAKGWVVQYLIPRLIPCAPRRFFESVQ